MADRFLARHGCWFEERPQLIVYTGNAEVGLPLEWAAHVSRRTPVVVHFDVCSAEIVGFVEAGQDFVFGDGNRVGAPDWPFDLDESKLAFSRNPGLDVVAQLSLLTSRGS